ncbi:hypothetical protein SAMN05444397_10851 [Flavobacterium aquidurense]|nr:hypothetical protein [Flavobacterium frigidimaris]SDZ51355.1 hypothetical protein SAMN05444397_10851 [Flavobacterium aquidurense]
MHRSQTKISNLIRQKIFVNDVVNITNGQAKDGKNHLIKVSSLIVDQNVSERLETDEFDKNI